MAASDEAQRNLSDHSGKTSQDLWHLPLPSVSPRCQTRQSFTCSAGQRGGVWRRRGGGGGGGGVVTLL